MNWQDKGYLISKNKYSENSVIAEFFTEFHGKTSGVIYGATSKKVKNYLLIGNKFHLNFNSKNINKVGYFNLEIDYINTPLYLDNKKKLHCIVYAMHLIKYLTVENQDNKNIFYLLEDLFKLLNNDDWLKNFTLWELQFFKNIGYNINFVDYASKQNINGNEAFVVRSSNSKRIVPTFLIDKNVLPLNENEIINALKLVGDFLDKTILKPNNINFPISRMDFLNQLK